MDEIEFLTCANCLSGICDVCNCCHWCEETYDQNPLFVLFENVEIEMASPRILIGLSIGVVQNWLGS